MDIYLELDNIGNRFGSNIVVRSNDLDCESTEKELLPLIVDFSRFLSLEKNSDISNGQVYGPRETSPEDDTDKEDEHFDYMMHSKGISTFVESVKARQRRVSAKKKSGKELTTDDVGVEDLVVGAITFLKVYCDNSDKIQHLTLLAVRHPFQKLGLGTYLINQMKEQSLTGPFDAIVVHADYNAIDFFKKQGFSDDLILISRWGEVADRFTDCTMMAYIPPFSTIHDMSTNFSKLSKELHSLQSKSRVAYQQQAQFIQSLLHEVTRLNSMLESQKSSIEVLQNENRRLRDEKLRSQKEFLHYKLSHEKRCDCNDLSSDDNNFLDDQEAERLLEQLTDGLSFQEIQNMVDPDAPKWSSKKLFLLSFVLVLLGCLLNVIGFSTPYWLASWPRYHSDFVRLGLWEACFAGFTFPQDYLSKTYYGCWWIFSKEYFYIRSWLLPWWFVFCQALATIALLMYIASAILTTHLYLKKKNKKRKPKLLNICSYMLLAAGFVQAIVAIAFGIGHENRLWMPRTHQNYPSWSYGLFVLSGFFSIFAGIAIKVYSIQRRIDIRTKKKKGPRPPGRQDL